MKKSNKYGAINQKNRILAILLVLCLAMSGLTGCAKDADTKKDDKPVPTTAAANNESNKDNEENVEKQKLVVALQTDGFITDYEDNYITKLLAQELGVDIEIYQLPTDSNELRTKMSLMISSGKDLPDVFCTGALSQEIILDYGSKGAFVSLNDYVNDPNLAVNFNAIPEEDRNTMLTGMTSADGNIYTLPRFAPTTWNMTFYRMYMNRTWLDNLGLEVPTTTDEYYNVLKQFAENDPNGNGLKDEIAVHGLAQGGYGENVTMALMNAFVFYNGGFALSEDGATVIAPYTTDEWKDGLEYMNKLYTEGLLPASVFTDDSTQFKSILNNESVNLVGSVTAGSYGNWTDAANNPNFRDMTIVKPLQGPSGKAYTPFFAYNPDPFWFVSSSSENPELAFQLGDLFYRKDISISARYGEEGVDWTQDIDTSAGYTNEYIQLGLYDEVTLVDLGEIWAENTNKFWRNINPQYMSLDQGNTIADLKYDPASPIGQLKAYNYEHYYPAHPEHILPALKYTIEEAEMTMETATNIPEYVKQSLAEFVTGARKLSDWDKYLSDLNKMGLEQWLSNAQEAYNRTK